jgi:hypothetical protein
LLRAVWALINLKNNHNLSGASCDTIFSENANVKPPKVYITLEVFWLSLQKIKPSV